MDSDPKQCDSMSFGHQIPPTQFKVLSVIEDNAYTLYNNQRCLIEMYILHPHNYMVMWSNSTTVYAIQMKNTGIIVFNVASIEPMLDCFLSFFIVKIRYRIDQGEVKEVMASCDLLDPKTRIGNNLFQFEQKNERLAMSFTYLGYNQETQAFGLQNLGFTLFIKKPKVQRAPTNRAMSMEVNTYHNSLLTKPMNPPMNIPQGLAPGGGPVMRPKGSSKVLKTTSRVFQPPGKIESSNSMASYRTAPLVKHDKQEQEQTYLKEKDKILNMDTKEICEVMTDSSGNYIVQEVFKLCTPDEHIKIIEKIQSKIVELSCHKKGTHSIQTLVVELKQKNEIDKFLEILGEEKHSLASSSYGTFVLQKVVDHFPEDLLGPIFEFCRDNFIHMSTNKNGLPIIKKALVKFKKSKLSFMEIINEQVTFLAQHPFGNYALQVAIDSWESEDCDNIICTVLENLQQLSMQKFSSNVVEKCIDKASQEIISNFLEVINNKEFMKMAVRNMYTFFVVERALMRSGDQNTKFEIAQKIHSCVLNNPSDKSLKRKWTKLYENIMGCVQ